MLHPRQIHQLMLGLLLAGLMTSAQAFDADTLKRLFDEGNSEEAYAYAKQHLYRYEGTVTFDYYYGMLAIDQGDISQGIFALERVLALQPKMAAARLELARGYFLLEEYQRARAEFERVLTQNPPPVVKARIDRYLNAIRQQEARYQTTSGFYVETRIGYDSNANGGPSESSIFIPLFGFTSDISESSQPQEDAFLSLNLGANVNSPMEALKGWSWIGQAGFNTLSYSEVSDYSSAQFNLQAGVQRLSDASKQRITLRYQPYYLGGDAYRQFTGLHLQSDHRITPLWRTNYFLQYGDTVYVDSPNRDASNLSLGLGGSLRVSKNSGSQLFSSLYYGIDDAKEDNITAQSTTDRDYYGLRLGGLWSLTSEHALILSLNRQFSQYSEEDPLFQTLRKDEQTGTNLGWQWIVNRHWVLKTNLSYSDNQSTVDTNTYNRTQASISLRYSQ